MKSVSPLPDSAQAQLNADTQEARTGPFKDIIGHSRKMRSVFETVQKVADSDTTIIVNGETGTGKGLVARAIHQISPRCKKPFVQINCGAIPEGLLESELFGHVRGAFTGATTAKTGKFELAHGGTIFLDEIGDMGAELQVKLLRVLEEREFEPVGGTKTVRVDVRVIAATHRDLDEAVQKGVFREDLYYRLYVIPVLMPPLKERPADIPALIDHFIEHMNRDKNRQVPGVSTEVRDLLTGYHWPGNVRELKNLIERLVVLGGERVIGLEDLPPKFKSARRQVTVKPEVPISDHGFCLATEVTAYERQLILKTLEKTNWVKNRAAKLLNVNRTTLVEKIKRYKLTKP